MTTQTNRLTSIISISLLCLAIGVVWYLVPHPLVAIVISFLPLGALFVINKTFWLVIMFVVFSFFRIHEAIPVLYSLKNPAITLSWGSFCFTLACVN